MELVSIKGKVKKRVGRGLSAGQGKTAGRGTKGQKSRSGFNIPRKFEGGQTPLSMRLPILPGFKSHKRKAEVISLDVISANYKAGETVNLESLMEKGLISGNNPAKVLNNGTLTVSVKLGDDIRVSDSVRAIIDKAPKGNPSGPVKAEKVEKTEEKTTPVVAEEAKPVEAETPKVKKTPTKKPSIKK